MTNLTDSDIPDELRLAACAGAMNMMLDMMKVTKKPRFDAGDAHVVLLSIPFAEIGHGGEVSTVQAYAATRIRAEIAREDLEVILEEIRKNGRKRSEERRVGKECA